jgi:HAD superfamily hydrolase (TIGR01509 family)
VREPTAGRVATTVGYDLVIFDCDGVLVDSERLAIRIEAAILTGLGWPMTQDEVVQRFVGRSAEYMQHEIERTIGRPIDWEAEFETRYREVFSRELQAVDGVEAALTRITVPVCVASSGTHEKIRFSLGLTGLLDRFDGHIFSVEDVVHGKPAPDLFLHAAEQMGHTPDRCAVIEDSASGVDAGLAAGMTVFAFAGGVTPRSRLALDGVVVFDTMAELPGLLQRGAS